MQTLPTEIPTSNIQAAVNHKKPFRVLMIGALPRNLSQVKGGVEAVILNLFSGFSQLEGVEVMHVAFSKEVNTQVNQRFSTNVEICYLPFVVAAEIPDYLINYKAFRQLSKRFNPDVVHIQEITPQILRFLSSDKSGIVVTQHGIMKEELKYASGLGQKLKCHFKALVEKHVFPLFPNVVFISEYNRRLYSARATHEAQIYNPVNPIFFESAPGQITRTNRIIYVGVLSPRKNIRVVIEALARLRDSGKSYHLDVVGGYKDSSYENEISSLTYRLNMKDQITFHGWKSQTDLRRIMAECPLFILPSQQETLPVSIAEAMALGKVVIASDVGAVREMFTHGTSGFLFRKNDTEDLVRVLNDVDTRSDWDAIAREARLEAERKFHPLTIAMQTLDFYKKVVDSNNVEKGK